MKELILCTPKQLPNHQWIAAAETAVRQNPANRPMLERLPLVVKGFVPTKMAIAVVTSKYWGRGGVKLPVRFLDGPAADLRKRILLHMNAWAKTANVQFAETKGTGRVRIARVAGGEDGGYWSYVGTDIEHIPDVEPTMNLEGFTMNTRESEFHRVVRHETGHTLGCPHEHMREELVDRIDRDKAIKYFLDNDGWDEAMVQQQVLTPIGESSLMHTPHADQDSIMCYQLPGSITKDGQPIIGGIDIDASDYAFMASCYPKATKAPLAPAKKKAAAGKKKPKKKR